MDQCCSTANGQRPSGIERSVDVERSRLREKHASVADVRFTLFMLGIVALYYAVASVAMLVR
jgi:hypothetical protein